MNRPPRAPQPGLVVEFAGSMVTVLPWETDHRGFRRLARWGGVAAGLAALAEVLVEDPARPALMIGVGEAVIRGVPTAERATVVGRSPLTGHLAQGQIGGGLGPALSCWAPFVLIRGRWSGRDGVLFLERGSVARVEARPNLRGCSPHEKLALLEREGGTRAALTLGPAGEAGLAFASLASGSGPSFVGRGGLGALLGALGLLAIVVSTGEAKRERVWERGRMAAKPGAASRGGSPPSRRSFAPSADGEQEDRRSRFVELSRSLSHSPRLRARSRGGTFERLGALAARREWPWDVAEAWYRGLRERARGRRGCHGCPTPCGWVFRGDAPAPPAPRFRALEALGRRLGLERWEEALELGSLTDRLGLDARETGRCLELAIALDPCLAGNLPRLRAEVRRWICEPEHPARGGAVAWAKQAGRDDSGWGQGRKRTQAETLAACMGGRDPMRSFPFLQELATAADLEAVVGLAFPEGSEDPEDPRGKGRLLAWSEALVAALDASGFCAFSAAALLADGLADLDTLGRWILPERLAEADAHDWEGIGAGDRLLALGVNLTLLRRRVDRALGAPPPPQLPGVEGGEAMLAEYLALTADRGQELGTSEPWRGFRRAWADLGRDGSVRERSTRPPTLPGEVVLRAAGPMADVLGAERRWTVLLPAPLEEVLAEVAAREPDAAAWLFHRERLLPAVWRRGRRLGARGIVRGGDVLDLVTAIAGG